MSIQDTGIYRKDKKEQYYTNDDTAKQCVDIILKRIPEYQKYIWVEPSAGNGVFLKYVPPGVKSVGLDIDPKHEKIQAHDYSKWNPDIKTPIIVFGNPPFGRQSSLAKSFIRHSCIFSEAVAFILPRSFQKPSMNSCFPPNFHNIHSSSIPDNSFLVNSKVYNVPCVFQIWKKMPSPRYKEPKVLPYKYSYVSQDSDYSFAIRRVGGRAGSCILPGTRHSNQTHRFIKLEPDITMYTEQIIEKLNGHTFPSNTVGPRSISTQEINTVINSTIKSITN